MYRFFSAHIFAIIVAVLLIAVAGSLLYKTITRDPLAGRIITTVERGTVENIVSVSGIMNAENTAELAFPSTGVVSNVYVKEGDLVVTGDILATLGADSLVAERASALAEKRLAEADKAELLSGATTETRAVTDTTVSIAEEDLARVKEAQRLAITNAERILFSSNLMARTNESNEAAPAPSISGTYICDEKGVYIINVYSSNAESGYSYRLSGLESGTFIASKKQPAPLGTCGLYALFSSSGKYSDTRWEIEIPNTVASTYATNLNTFNTAKISANNAISAAEQAVTLAKSKQKQENATPRTEAVARAQARIDQASARIAQIDSQIRDRSIMAPFSGTVSEVDILPGETAGTAPVFTVLASDTFELIARIPEIDVTKIIIGQPARVVFDARTSETLIGSVSYIAPLPTQIDGVAYFEVKIILEEPPVWLRGGLNADVDIIISVQNEVLRIPKRYLTTEQEISSVQTLTSTNNLTATTTVKKIFEGNDGFVVIEGVPEGTTIVAP